MQWRRQWRGWARQAHAVCRVCAWRPCTPRCPGSLTSAPAPAPALGSPPPPAPPPPSADVLKDFCGKLAVWGDVDRKLQVRRWYTRVCVRGRGTGGRGMDRHACWGEHAGMWQIQAAAGSMPAAGCARARARVHSGCKLPPAGERASGGPAGPPCACHAPALPIPTDPAPGPLSASLPPRAEVHGPHAAVCGGGGPCGPAGAARPGLAGSAGR